MAEFQTDKVEKWETTAPNGETVLVVRATDYEAIATRSEPSEDGMIWNPGEGSF